MPIFPWFFDHHTHHHHDVIGNTHQNGAFPIWGSSSGKTDQQAAAAPKSSIWTKLFGPKVDHLGNCKSCLTSSNKRFFDDSTAKCDDHCVAKKLFSFYQGNTECSKTDCLRFVNVYKADNKINTRRKAV